MPRPPRARERVLDAAEQVLLDLGATAFTLDAVAARARVSKGGLIYHFPSKEALLEALVDRAVAAVDAALADAAADPSPGAFTRAYLDVTVPPEAPDTGAAGSTGTPAADSTGTSAGGSRPMDALVVAVALDPRLLAPLRAAYARWQERLESDGIDSAAATAVRLAVDGWWLATVLDLPELSADTRRRTRQLLADLATGSSPGPANRAGEGSAWWRS